MRNLLVSLLGEKLLQLIIKLMDSAHDGREFFLGFREVGVTTVDESIKKVYIFVKDL